MKIKKGTKLTILAYDFRGYAWTFRGNKKYDNWVYPHHTANWFVSPEKYKQLQRQRQEKAFLKRTQKYDVYYYDKAGAYIKGIGKLVLGSGYYRPEEIFLAGSINVDRTSDPVEINDIISKYFIFTLDDGQRLHFQMKSTRRKDNYVLPGKWANFTLTTNKKYPVIPGSTISITSPSNIKTNKAGLKTNVLIGKYSY